MNGRNFLDIEHQEAVEILKSSKLMMMTIKDVGKLPYARTTIDRTQWLTGQEIDHNQSTGSKSNGKDDADSIYSDIPERPSVRNGCSHLMKFKIKG